LSCEEEKIQSEMLENKGNLNNDLISKAVLGPEEEEKVNSTSAFVIDQEIKEDQKKGYVAHSHSLKLKVLQLYIEKVKGEENEPKPKSEIKLLKETVEEVNKNINIETARSWVKSRACSHFAIENLS